MRIPKVFLCIIFLGVSTLAAGCALHKPMHESDADLDRTINSVSPMAMHAPESRDDNVQEGFLQQPSGT